MTRVLLILLLSMVVSRLFWRIVASFREGLGGGPAGSSVPRAGTHMVRDPVCGTFVVPERAVTLVDGRARMFFCSDACRDKYRARTA